MKIELTKEQFSLILSALQVAADETGREKYEELATELYPLLEE